MSRIAQTDHWQQVYTTKAASGLSWYQHRPATSLDLIARHAPAAMSAIDVGGGASTLVDHLLAAGLSRVAVLDLSAEALAVSQTRLGDAATKVDWIAGDITTTTLDGQFDVWHDRAVFHFLTEASDRASYRRVLLDGLAPGGIAVIATFALSGPEKCSGLPVARYSPQTLAAELGAGLDLIDQTEETHQTPGGSAQAFQYSVFRKLA